MAKWFGRHFAGILKFILLFGIVVYWFKWLGAVKSYCKLRGRVTHIYNTELIIIGSGNGLSPIRRQAIAWTNADLL